MNAYDDSNSTWSYIGEGNYWDDYTGIDADGDGIGDTPYHIYGGSTKDNYPLMEPVQTPGFELIVAFCAILIIILYMMYKKKRVK